MSRPIHRRIKALEDNDDTIESAATTLAARVTVNEDDITALDGRVDALENP